MILKDILLNCNPPHFLVDNTMYLTRMGSVAYGVSDDLSDEDLYGWCIPPKEYLFPSSFGYIEGFDSPPEFEQYQKHHIESGEKQFDVVIYNVTKYFRLVMENNPNMIDSLFTARKHILHSTEASELVRENRKLFIHKGCFVKFRGYSYSQMQKMFHFHAEGKRKEQIEKQGYDVKFAYHLVRLLGEVKQLLTTGDLDLEKDNEILKEIRGGEWTSQEVVRYFEENEKILEKQYEESKLPERPDFFEIKKLLMNILETHYGSFNEIKQSDEKAYHFMDQIMEICEQWRRTK